MLFSVFILLEIIVAVKAWQCVSPIRKVYCRENSNAFLRFSADLTNLYSRRRFEILFNDGSVNARITYNAEKTSSTDSIPGVSVIGDTAGNVVVTLTNVNKNAIGVYMLVSAGFSTKCNCLYILGTPRKPTVTESKTPSVGESVTMTCSSTSTTTPSNHSLSLKYDWRVDNIENPSGAKYSYTSYRSKLTVSSIVRNDANKRVTCTATEDVTDGYTSSRSDQFSFEVYYGPDNFKFTPIDSSYEKVENDSINQVTCRATCYPRCWFTWTKTEGNRVVNRTAILNLGRLHRSEAGIYRCTASRFGGSPQSKDLIVNVIYGPYLSSTQLIPSTKYYIKNEGQTINNINCSADCYPACIYTWSKTRHGQTETVSTASSVLSLGILHRNDAALYTCTAKNPGKISFPTITKETEVNVRYGPDSAKVDKKSPYTVTEWDTNVSIECTSDCYPGCSFKWTTITSSNPISSNQILHLENVSRYDAGDYKCLVTSSALSEFSKSAESTVEVIVQYAPDVSINLTKATIKEGENLTLYCNGHGLPSVYNYISLKQSWNNIIIPNNNTAVSGTELWSSLYFKSLRFDDTGTYTCTLNNGIRNRYGILNQTTSKEIIVQVPPKVLRNDLRFTGLTGDSIRIEIPVYSEPKLESITITRYDGQSISQDRVIVTKEQLETRFYDKRVTLQGSMISLVLKDTREEDFGNYSVIMKNTLNTTQVVVFVIAEEWQMKKDNSRTDVIVAGVFSPLIIGVIVGIVILLWKRKMSTKERAARSISESTTRIDSSSLELYEGLHDFRETNESESYDKLNLRQEDASNKVDFGTEENLSVATCDTTDNVNVYENLKIKKL